MGVGGTYALILANLTAVVYIYSDTWARNTLEEIWDGLKGVLVADFYSAYKYVASLSRSDLISSIGLAFAFSASASVLVAESGPGIPAGASSLIAIVYSPPSART